MPYNYAIVYLSAQRLVILSTQDRPTDLLDTIIKNIFLAHFFRARGTMTTKASLVKLTTFSPCIDDNDTTSPIVPSDLSHVLTGVKFPDNSLSALYGHNSGSGVASAAIDMAEAQGFSCRSFELLVTNNKWTIQTIGLEATANSPALSEMNVLTLNRCRKDLRRVVFDCWGVFTDQDSCTPDEREVLKAEDPIFATSRPDFIGYLHAQPEFKHLDVITYRVNTGSEIVSMASVFSLGCIDSQNIKIGFGPLADMPVLPKF